MAVMAVRHDNVLQGDTLVQGDWLPLTSHSVLYIDNFDDRGSLQGDNEC